MPFTTSVSADSTTILTKVWTANIVVVWFISADPILTPVDILILYKKDIQIQRKEIIIGR
jgi:hypothetical protein